MRKKCIKLNLVIFQYVKQTIKIFPVFHKKARMHKLGALYVGTPNRSDVFCDGKYLIVGSSRVGLGHRGPSNDHPVSLGSSADVRAANYQFLVYYCPAPVQQSTLTPVSMSTIPAYQHQYNRDCITLKGNMIKKRMIDYCS